MAKRVVTRIGDIFSIRIGCDKVRCFQMVAKDSTQLYSAVIRMFKRIYAPESIPSMEEIASDEVAFYSHTFIRLGLKMGFWEKIGSHREEDLNVAKILFGEVDDLRAEASVFNRNPLCYWRIWNVGLESKRIGRLPKELKDNTEVGYVMPPNEILERAKRGYFIYSSEEYDVLKRIPFPEYESYIRRESSNNLEYLHFIGESAVRQVIVKKGRVRAKMSITKPNAGFCHRLRKKKFWETNWEYDDFITKEQFEAVWNA